MTIQRFIKTILTGLVLATIALARPLPQLVSEDGRQAYLADGKLLLTSVAKSESASAASLPLKSRREVKQEFEETPNLDVIFVPTPQDVVDRMLKLAKVNKDDLVYDLGCGDGRIVVTAAKKYGAKCVGYDIDPQRIKESLENVRKNNVGHLVRIERKDIFTLDLSEADVITLYLLGRLNRRLIPQLEKLKPGSRIVSHEFDMSGIIPDTSFTVISSEDDDEHEIYFWTTPLKKREESGE